MSRRVVVTGIGIVSPIGIGAEAFWRAALAGTAAWSPIPAHWIDFYQPNSTIWAPLPPLDLAALGITRIESTQLDKAEQLSLVCAKLALDHAGIRYELKDEKKNTYVLPGIDAEDAGVFMGTGFGGGSTVCASTVAHCSQPLLVQLVAVQKLAAAAGVSAELTAGMDRMRGLIRGSLRFNPFTVPMAMANGNSAVVGIRYGLHGRNESCVAACASGTVALGHALRAVSSGEMSVALAGGVDYLAEDWGGIFRGFDIVQTLAKAGDNPATANRPFDARRSGFLFAEGGGAVLVLEALDHARRRGATILAELAGYAETFDAHSVMMLEPSGAQIERMVRRAVADAGVTVDDVDYVNTHGTGTLLNDETEAAMLTRVFGDRPLVNSTKGLVGHTIGASGAIEAVVSVLSLRDQTTHVCANLEAPIPGLRYVRTVEPQRIRTVLSESFAFGGHNAAIVFKAFSA